MGVMLRRTGLLMLLVIAVLLPLRGRPTQKPPGDGTRVARLYALEQDARDARLRWSALSERDSALALLGQLSGSPATVTIRTRGFAKGIGTGRLDSAVADVWKAVRPVDSAVRTALLVYNPAAYTVSVWQTYAGNLFANRNGEQWCLAIAPGTTQHDRLIVYRDLLERVLAPCVLRANFGPPGPALSAWLQSTRWSAARSNAWLSFGEAYVDESGSGPWAWLPEANAGGEPGILPNLLGPSAHRIAVLLSPPYRDGAPGVRCLDGHEPSCERAILGSAIMGVDPRVPADLTVTPTLLRPAEVTLTTTRPPESFFLSDVIRSFGRERFARFWSSDSSFEAAFEHSFGESLGAWTARWARRQWADSWPARYGGERIVLGANLGLSWPLLVLVWGTLSVLLVARAAHRRQVT